MRVVLDTNVFVSLLIRPGDTFLALADYIDRSTTILYSEETLTELVDVLRRRKFSKYTAPEEVAEFVRWIVGTGELVAVTDHLTGSRDVTDNKFLSLAVAGQADYLVTGDKDLLVLGRIKATPILSPSDFLAAVNRQ